MRILGTRNLPDWTIDTREVYGQEVADNSRNRQITVGQRATMVVERTKHVVTSHDPICHIRMQTLVFCRTREAEVPCATIAQISRRSPDCSNDGGHGGQVDEHRPFCVMQQLAGFTRAPE